MKDIVGTLFNPVVVYNPDTGDSLATGELIILHDEPAYQYVESKDDGRVKIGRRQRVAEVRVFGNAETLRQMAASLITYARELDSFEHRLRHLPQVEPPDTAPDGELPFTSSKG